MKYDNIPSPGSILAMLAQLVLGFLLLIVVVGFWVKTKVFDRKP